ncbi:MAG: S41 family peptidase [Niastella sp.]|uniref:S41 family peptidase n=1 Tax=Niastella sp. TaxID=1869183 RepID=UPI00389A19E1
MKKGIITIVCLILLSFTGPPDDQQRILTQVGTMLEQRHYLQPVINDHFSEGIWEAHLHTLDNRKNIFLEEDILLLGAYKLSLDNELHGDSIKFFPAVTSLYAKRYNEAAVIYRRLLSRPITFNDKDSIFPDQEPVEFPRNEAVREQRWNNYLKQIVLDKLTALQEQRAQSKTGDATHGKTDKQLEQQARESLLKQLDRKLTRYFAQNTQQLFSNYLNCILRYADPHSDYFPPLDKQEFDQHMANRFYGIGSLLQEDEEGHVIIASLDAGGPAWKSNVLAINDQIVKVGQGNEDTLTEVEGMSVKEVARLIRGEKGTVVKLYCRKGDGSIIDVALVREEIRREEAGVRSAIIMKDGKKTGYIYLPVFYDDFTHEDGAHCADDIEQEVIKLKGENVNSIIIDLRNNGGGSLAQVIKMVGLFVGRGPVVQVKAGNGTPQILASNRPEPLYSGPLAVMVNELSASASEIFAAAIQDYKRGVIIGSSTFGKGTVQTQMQLSLEKEGALKLTVKKFYRINGGSTQQKGVIPDIVLPDIYETQGIHEGNMPFALNWDKIQPIAFTPQASSNIDQLTAHAEQDISHDSAFNSIRRYNDSLGNFRNTRGQGMPLGLFRAYLVQRARIAHRFETILQLPDKRKMDIRELPGKDNGPWVKGLAKDIYLEQVLKTMMKIQ